MNQTYDIESGKKKEILELISRFKFISKMKENEKLDISTLTLKEVTWYNSFIRTLYNLQDGKEDKDQTLKFIGDLYKDAIDYIKILSKGDRFHMDICKMLIEAMREALGNVKDKTGVESLKLTYQNNKMFVSKVETFLQVTNTQVSHLETNFESKDKNIL